LVINGQLIRAFESNFPAFEVGEEYVFALLKDPKADTYFVLGGDQGAFRVGGDFVARQLTQYDGQPLQLPLDVLRERIVALADAQLPLK
jgi:hypothetical protein